MKFEQFLAMRTRTLATCLEEGLAYPDPQQLNPILLAYIGDMVFSMYVRLRYLPASKLVRVIHNLSAQTVSAVCQAKALQAMLADLTEQELLIVKRGRNTKSMVPKSASMHEYRMSTAFEALLGWLYLTGQDDRLQEILKKAFEYIAADLAEK